MYKIIKLMTVLQNGFYNKQFFVYFKYSLRCSLFLNFLWKNNIILGYITDKKKFKIFLKILLKKPMYCFFKNIYTKKNKIFLNLKQINNLKKTKFYVFNTTQGFLNLNECQKNKIGGILIFVLQ